MKPLASPCMNEPAGELEDLSHPKSSVDSSTDSPAEPTSSPSSPAKPALRSSTNLGQSQHQSLATGSANSSQLPGKLRGGLQSRANSSDRKSVV